MSDRFKFRQEAKNKKSNGCAWHYWGYIDNSFVSPMGENMGGKSYQCTGLKDKNGVLIYEGDIVEYGTTDKKPFCASVEWESVMFGLRVYESKDFVYFDSELAETAHMYTVVGNIYETPELLKSEL